MMLSKLLPGSILRASPLPDNKFIVHKYKAKSGHPSRAGVLRIVSWMYLFKNYDLKDWVSFCEVFGMPLRLGKYDASASDADKAALMEAIIQLGTDAAGIVPSTTTIDFIESNKQSSAEIYEKLARYCDEQMSKAVLGQTLTSDSGSGSYAQSKTHNEVRKDLTAADANALENTLRRDLIRPLVEFNFGPGTPIPTLQFQTEDADDLKETSEIYRTLACDMGLEIPKRHLYKKFGIPQAGTWGTGDATPAGSWSAGDGNAAQIKGIWGIGPTALHRRPGRGVHQKGQRDIYPAYAACSQHN